MRWEDGRESQNVDDDRGEGGGGQGFGGGGGGGMGGLGMLLGLLPLLGRGGMGGIVILVIVGLFMFGGPLLRGMGGGGQAQHAPGYQGPASAPAGRPAGADSQGEDLRFVKVVAGYTEDTWGEIFREAGKTYSAPRFTIYTGGHKTACGFGQAEMGPFYCPGDRRVYLDLAFFQELSGRFGAPGRFAEAYVVAHEVGHHVQNLLGAMDSRDATRGGSRNQTSVRTELQADCYAGVWANRTERDHHILDPGDLEQGLKAATAVGDDTLQRQARGSVAPDSFTHGSSAQRVRWLRAGYDSGDLARCDTFSPAYGEL